MTPVLLSILLFICIVTGYCQVPDQKEKNTTFYPLNIPYALFGRYHVSMEFGNPNNNVLIGGHYNKNLLFEKGSGGPGFEFQFRSNFNRDPNVFFSRLAYWGPYLEYDQLNDAMFSGKIKITSIGILTGVTFNHQNNVVFDVFYGISISSIKEDNTYGYDNNYVTPLYKAGAQLGFKF